MEVVVTTLIVYFASGHSINRKHLLQFLAAFVVALAFGFAVGATYNTYRERGLVAALVEVSMAVRVGWVLGHHYLILVAAAMILF